MMKPLEVARNAFRTLWSNKALWLFGFFLAGGGGGAGGRVSHHDAAGRASTGLSAGSLPAWIWPAIAIGALFAIGALIMHVVSEGALISGVRASRQGERMRIRDGFRVGFRTFGRVLGIKVVLGAVMVAIIAVVALPAVLAGLHVLPGLAALGAIPLALVGLPAVLTVYFVTNYALRISVLDGDGVFASVRAARQYLSGRLLDSVKLFVVTVLGQAGGTAVIVALLLPVALLGYLAYLAAGVPALVVLAVVIAPVIAALVGAMGTYRSAVWTIGFLEGRAEGA